MNQLQPTLDIDTTPAETPDQQERDRVREIYRARLAEKLKDPEFRKIEGFPIGTDEAILALSDPPHYTACPNPFLDEWLAENAKPYDAATDDYHREPFAADVSEGKNDPIYNAHSYHTKVPHKAIMRYILHYTEPGDVVYDGFCGTGMTGVAAQMCGNKAQVESLGYTVTADGAILDAEGQQISRLGARKAILNDLSPAATFIAFNFNTPVESAAFEREAKRILMEVEAESGWMYSALYDATPEETDQIAIAVRSCSSANDLKELYAALKSGNSPLRCPNSRLQVGRINFTIWSDVLICPNCTSEIVFWNAAVDETAGKVLDTFICSQCRAEVTKRQCGRAKSTHYDQALGRAVVQVKQVPVLISSYLGKKREERKADAADLALVEKIGFLKPSEWFPTRELPEGDKMGEPKRVGISHAHLNYSPRNLSCLSSLWKRLKNNPGGGFLFTSTLPWTTRQNRLLLSNYFQRKGGVIGQTLQGTLYISSIAVETNALYRFQLRGSSANIGAAGGTAFIGCGSATDVPTVPSNSVTYIFTDPPFGGNLMYSELNFGWESWLDIYTNNTPEAITNVTQKKCLRDYQGLMTKGFSEYYRVLQPGKWMTVEFHNSANAVWNSIQEGLERAGFIVADVRILTKQHNTFNQVTAAGAVQRDLVISCYKPNSQFENRFQQIKGQPEGVLEFLRQHLSMLPIAPITAGGKLEPVVERTRYMLFDRMIAYHLQRNAPIPMDSATFYKLLEDQFTTRDEMYFLPDQAARFDALKSRGYETEQLSIFLQDEKSAVQWVRTELSETPQTLGDLTPKFMQELREWPKHEPRPELRDLLREYFIQGDGGVWRVPNPDDEKDIEVLRRSALLRLFQGYTREKGALKTFRKEAVMEGFKRCYETKQYGVIVAICEKIPAKVFQDISEFVMFYDIAKDMIKDLTPEQLEQIEFMWE